MSSCNVLLARTHQQGRDLQAELDLDVKIVCGSVRAVEGLRVNDIYLAPDWEMGPQASEVLDSLRRSQLKSKFRNPDLREVHL